MENFNWSSFSVRIPVKASPKDLYKAWSTKKGIEQWFLRLAEYKTPDGALRAPAEEVAEHDTYKWLWHGYGDESVEHGEILNCNGKDALSFRFGPAGDCTVRIKQEQGETIVELTQEHIPTDEKGRQQFYIGCKMGWTFYLANLKSVLEGGIDLRNRNEHLRQVINS